MVVAARVLAGEVEPEVLVEPLVLVEDDVLVLVLPEVLPTVTVEVEVDTVGVKGGVGVGAEGVTGGVGVGTAGVTQSTPKQRTPLHFASIQIAPSEQELTAQSQLMVSPSLQVIVTKPPHDLVLDDGVGLGVLQSAESLATDPNPNSNTTFLNFILNY